MGWGRTTGVIVLTTLVVFAAQVISQEPTTEIEALMKMQSSAPDHGGIMYELAMAYARAGNTTEAIHWIAQALRLGLDFNLAEEPAFASMRNSPEFRAIVARAATNRVVANTSTVAFTVSEKDLIPEGIAYDPADDSFYLGSIYKRKIVRVEKNGKATDFVKSGQNGLWEVLGMKVDEKRRVLWACSAAGAEAGDAEGCSGVFAYDLKTGKLVKKYVMDNHVWTHLFNDLVISSGGDVYVTDSVEDGNIYWIPAASEQISPFLHLGQLSFPNGIALSPDERRIFVADFPNGIATIDVRSREVRRMGHPDNVCLSGIDGLYFHQGALIAIQNSAGIERVVRCYLNATMDRVERLRVIESRNPLFLVPTTGVIAGQNFCYIANSQIGAIDEKGKLKPGQKLQDALVLRAPLDQ